MVFYLVVWIAYASILTLKTLFWNDSIYFFFDWINSSLSITLQPWNMAELTKLTFWKGSNFLLDFFYQFYSTVIVTKIFNSIAIFTWNIFVSQTALYKQLNCQVWEFATTAIWTHAMNQSVNVDTHTHTKRKINRNWSIQSKTNLKRGRSSVNRIAFHDQIRLSYIIMLSAAIVLVLMEYVLVDRTKKMKWMWEESFEKIVPIHI